MISQRLNKILCVNDNQITLFILKRMLDKIRFTEEIIEASDGWKALTYCNHLIKDPAHSEEYTYPGLIFLDLHMPIMDGWEFLDRFSKDILPYFKDTKVVITSQSVDEQDLERIKKYPFIIDFLKHPLTIEYLQNLKITLAKNHLLHN